MVQDSTIKKLAFIHGNVVTMDEKCPRAQAILVIQDKIIKVGSDAEITRLIDEDTEEIDLEGRTLVPGFIDCHAHPMIFGQLLMAVDCRTPPMNSIKEMMEIIRKTAKEKSAREWIQGWGYDEFKLSENRHPTKWDLDAVAPNNPVIIGRMCGHISTVNSLALELAGISKELKDHMGGQIDREPETNEPTGVLRGSARDPVWKRIPSPNIEQLRNGINRAAEQFLARGVTSVSDAGVNAQLGSSQHNTMIMKAYQRAIWQDGMPLRVNLMMSVSVLKELAALGLSTGFGNERLRIGAIKMFADGGSSSRTAAISEPFVDAPDNTGIMYTSPDELCTHILAAHRAGFQVGVHAVGDRAISAVLNAIEAALKQIPKGDHRHRIEHCGVTNPTIISRLKELKVIPVSQPIFLYGEGESYRAGLGDTRMEWTYPLKSFIENGIMISISSDCPATSGSELISPLLGIYMAVTRNTDAGQEIGPTQKIEVEDALRAYTLNSAYATFEDRIKGSIEPGKLADFAILSNNPFTISKPEIKDITVEMTIVGGKIVYQKS